MGFFSKLFSKTPEDFLSHGNKLLEQERFFEARAAYEEGLQKSEQQGSENPSINVFIQKIAIANTGLAALNIKEAEHAITIGADVKAIEHLELAKTLTNDSKLREKAENLLKSLATIPSKPDKKTLSSGCSSCSSHEPQTQVETPCEDSNLSPLDYFDLLIRQLPGQMYNRYADLGEKFAYMYLAASRDEHEQALKMLEDCLTEANRDIYCYEKGMILYRLGQVHEAEQFLQQAIRLNADNPLSRLGLALLLIDCNRFKEADEHLASMIVEEILPDQALFLRANIAEMTEDIDNAIEKYGKLLSTGYARPAAEKLSSLLTVCNRHQEAEAVFKTYLKGCHH